MNESHATLSQTINTYNELSEKSEGAWCSIERFLNDHTTYFNSSGYYACTREQFQTERYAGIASFNLCDACEAGHNQPACSCSITCKSIDEDGIFYNSWGPTIPLALLDMDEDELFRWCLETYADKIEAKQAHLAARKKSREEADRAQLRELQRRYS